MKKGSLRVKWHPDARTSLKAIYLYIAKDSLTAAEKVKKTILKTTRSLGFSPEKFEKEKYLKELSGNFRSVTKWHYKIIYEVTDNEVIIIDIFHTSMDPEKMKKQF